LLILSFLFNIYDHYFQSRYHNNTIFQDFLLSLKTSYVIKQAPPGPYQAAPAAYAPALASTAAPMPASTSGTIAPTAAPMPASTSGTNAPIAAPMPASNSGTNAPTSTYGTQDSSLD
jgi:hypothetical protein